MGHDVVQLTGHAAALLDHRGPRVVLAIVPAALGSSVVTGAYLIAVGAGILRAATAGGGAQATFGRA